MVGTIVAAVVAVLALGALGAAAVQLRRRAIQVGSLEQDVQGATTAAAEADRRAAGAEDEARSAGQRAATAEASAVTLQDRLGAIAGVVWILERRRRARAWAVVVGQIGATPPDLGGDPSAGLADALALELEIIREEVGTPGRLVGGDQPLGPEPGAAVVGLLVATELLQALARRADSLRVSLAADGDATVVDLAGEGWQQRGGEGEVPVVEPAVLHDLTLASAGVGAELEIGAPDDDDVVRATLRLPTPEMSPAGSTG
jgi:hypothetical protein